MLKFKPENLNIEKFRPFLIPGAILALIIGSSLLLVLPKTRETFLIQRNLRQEEKRLAQLTAKAVALEGLNQAELSSKVDLTAKVLPSDKDLPLFLFVLKSLATENNIELRRLQVEPGEIVTASEEKGSLSFLTFSILLGGQMNDLKEFLTQTTKVAPLMVVRKIDIAREETGGGFQASLLLEAPFLSLPPSLGLVETPLASITDQEENIYKELAQLDFPLIKGTPPPVPTGKENPFAF